MTNSMSREQQLIGRLVELEAENQTLRAHIAELEQQVSKLLATPLRPKNGCNCPQICQTETTETSSQKAGTKAGARRQLSTSSH